MNIWSLEKCQSIRHVLLLLSARLGEANFRIDGNTATDHRAVYLCHISEPAVRAYLFTLGQRQDRYGVHLEYPLDANPENAIDIYENLSLSQLTEILAVHLDISDIHPLPERG